MQQPFDQILLGFFNKVSENMSLGESIFIGDNLDGNYNLLDFSMYSRPISFPMKLTFTSALLCCGGSVRTIVNRSEFVVESNDIFIVQGGSMVELVSSSDDLRVVGMAFADSAGEDFFGSSAINAGSYIMHRSVPLLIHIGKEEMQRQIELYKDVRRFYLSTDPAYRGDVVRGYLLIATGAFLSLMKKMSLCGNEGFENRREQELYLQFMDDLQLYAGRERTVSFYADRCCVSPKYFSKVIHLASGKTPIQLIRERVIVEAKVLLNSTDMSVQQIADVLNFPSDSFFCRYFRQVVHQSPMQYRESVQKG
ncbi:MAG: AraC family transcriptional regulator [Bacteroidales bacterium]|nr:AraC family transcriptional regulator [Bacteroidales bacterium]